MQKKKFTDYLQEYIMLIVLIVLLVAFGVICPIMTGRSFLSLANLMNILGQNAYLVITGIGITFIMLGGAMDLSTGYLLSTVGIVMALVDGGDSGGGSTIFIVTALVGILLSVVLSGFNGVMYAWLQVFPFVITLATQYMLNGATYLLSGGVSHT
ncbi:MAG: ABC transporter permease, partial [Parasporobacterium sp.]|nr:ABC transporter permease [Parasporobacterium sp.]